MREVTLRTPRCPRSVLALLIAMLAQTAASARAQTGDVPSTEVPPPPPAEIAPPADATPPSPAETSPSDTPGPRTPTAIPEPAPQGQPIPPARAGISGVVLDRETREPLPDARVIIEGNGRRRVRVTDAEGRFEANLRSGTYSVRAVYPMYRSARRSTVRVERGQRTTVEMPLRLFEADEEIIDVAIHVDRSTGEAALALRNQSAASVDAIGGEDIRNAGDSNAGRAATRIVGASVEEGSRLVVRGLGDRYSTVLLNGVPLPSTDPDRQGIQLDIIPASVIANLSIAKSFTPDMAANWAGGLMTIETISYPEEFTLRGGITLGYNSQSTFRQRLDYDGGRFDALGIDDGDRSLPSTFGNTFVLDQGAGGAYTREETAELLRQLQLNYEYRQRTAPPNMSFNLSLGDSIDLGRERRFGYLLAVTYSRNEQIRTGPMQRIVHRGSNPSNPEDYNVRLRSTVGSDEVLWSTFGTASFRYSPRGDVRLVTFYTQSASDEVRRVEGFDGASDVARIDQWQLRFLSRGVLFVQLAGEQRQLPLPPGSTLRWSLFTSRTHVSQPDTRQVGYADTSLMDQPLEWMNRANSSNRIYTDLSQQDVGGYLHLRTPLWTDATLAIGADLRVARRTFHLRQFQHLRDTFADPTIYQSRPNELFNANNAGVGGPFVFREITQPSSSYDAVQRNLAGFLMLDTALGEHVRVIAGARVESFTQNLDAYLLPEPVPFTFPPTARLRRTDVDWLPSVSGIFDLSEQMRIRSSYGVTLARPTLRENAPFAFYDFVRRRTVTGDVDLRRTRIHNADLRWEWFPSASEVIAASVFYKKFIDPIEQSPVSVGVDDLTFVNAESAYDVGVELEARFDLSRLTQALRYFHFNGNLAFIKSSVQYRPEDAVNAADPSRGLMGQSPFVANLSLKFDHPDAGVTATLIYNAVGPRIAYLGFRFPGDTFLPDTYELAFHSLDFVGSWDVNDHLSLRLTCRNLLNQRRRFVERTTQGNATSSAFRPGVDVSLGLSLAY